MNELRIKQRSGKLYSLMIRESDGSETELIHFCPSKEHAEVMKFRLGQSICPRLTWAMLQSETDFHLIWNRQARARRSQPILFGE